VKRCDKEFFDHGAISVGHPADAPARRPRVARIAVALTGLVLCACHSAQHAAPPSSTITSAPPPPPTTTSAAPLRIQPLPVRPVTKSQLTVPAKCPATNAAAPAAPTAVLVTCDLARTTLFTLGPQALRLTLTHVDPPKALPGDFFEVILTLDAPSAGAWAAFTAARLHSHVAFIRDDTVLEAPIIEYQVSSGRVALSTQTAPAADQLAQLVSRPA
jgi:hypothetical protein